MLPTPQLPFVFSVAKDCLPMTDMGDLKLDFIVAGPQRTATSWLHDRLAGHPEVALPFHVKETFFWDKYFDKGGEWYQRFFEERRETATVRGEVAPTVFASDVARERIRSVSPQCRVGVVLRDPVERMLSHYRHELALGLVRGTLCEAVQRDPRILESSRYSKYLPRWREAFGAERVHCIRYEAIREHPEEVLRELCVFLGVPAGVTFSDLDARPSEGSGVRFPGAARVMYRSASLLRRFHFHRWVDWGKRIGVRKLVQTATPPSVSDEDRRFAEEALQEEVRIMKDEL